MRLSEYVVLAQEILDRYKGANDMLTPQAWNEAPAALCRPDRDPPIPSLADFLVKSAPIPSGYLSHGALLRKILPPSVYSPSEQDKISRKTTLSKEVVELGKILDLFAKFGDVLRQQYGNDLKEEPSCSRERQQSASASRDTARCRC